MLDALEETDTNVPEFTRLVMQYGDVLEWGASFYGIQKLKSNKFHETLTPAQGLEEGMACLVDFMRDLDKELKIRESQVKE